MHHFLQNIALDEASQDMARDSEIARIEKLIKHLKTKINGPAASACRAWIFELSAKLAGLKSTAAKRDRIYKPYGYTHFSNQIDN